MPSEPARADAPQPPKYYLSFIRTIDKMTEWTGFCFTLLVVPLVLSNVVEVFMRYVLGRPTAWALDVTTMSFGALFMLGSAYALLKGAHVRTDMFWENFSDRNKGIIDSIAYVLLFLPSMALLFVISVDDFLYAYELGERAPSVWAPITWPLRAVIPVTALLLFLQGVSELMKSWWAVRTGRMLVHHEKIEI